MAMDIHPEDDTSYTTKCQEAFLKYLENKYCAKHRQMSGITSGNVPHRDIFPSAPVSAFG